MGLNMPARTVLFTSTRKFDGRSFRWVNRLFCIFTTSFLAVNVSMVRIEGYTTHEMYPASAKLMYSSQFTLCPFRHNLLLLVIKYQINF